MKRDLVKFSALVIALVLGISCLTGCGLRTGNSADENTAIVFEGEKIGADEAEFYIRVIQYETEASSASLIQAIYGDMTKFWANESEGKTFAEYAKTDAISRLIQTKTLVKKAQDDKITLTADETAKVDAAVAKFKETYKDVIEATGADDAMVRKYVEENTIAKKVYLSMIADVDTSMDAAEMQRKSFEGVSIVGQTSVEANEEKGIEAAEYTEEEAAANRKAAADEILEKMQNGTEITKIVEEYGERPEVSVSSFGTMTAAPTDVPETAGEFTDFRQKAWTMSNGEYDTVETKNSAGTAVYYVIHMVNDDDPDARAEAEKEELAKRKDTMFAEKYEAVKDKYSDYHVYESVLNKFKISDPIYVPVTSEAAED